jgi:hypothetical protein
METFVKLVAHIVAAVQRVVDMPVRAAEPVVQHMQALEQALMDVKHRAFKDGPRGYSISFTIEEWARFWQRITIK